MNNPNALFVRFALRSLRRCSLTALGFLAASVSWAQRTADPVVESAPAQKNEEVVSLSPFEVVTETKGYYASNTMSGTRFNSNLEDLAASISVMTKDQMQDFAMLDINDVFLYTASAEGTGTYTDFEVNRNGDVQENVSMNPTQANRVRGIAAANISLGNFETMGRVPVDPLAIDAVEISRGPNANVFGLGDPSGTVNMVPASANLQRNRAQLQARVDSYGGYRTSLDVNRVLLPGKLGIRGSGSFQHDAFKRKPSGTDAVRYNGMIKYQPFKLTTLTASYSYYRMHGNRPNASPPRDSITYWLENGSPTWDPVTRVIHVNGQTLGPFLNNADIPDYFNRSFTGTGRTYIYVGDTGIEYVGRGQGTSTETPGTGSGNIQLMSPSAGSGIAAGRFTAQPLFTTTPTVSDIGMYDWTSINLAAVNRVMDRTMTGTVQLDQIFLNTQRHTLAMQLGFMREDSKRYTRNIIGELNSNGQSGQLLIDVNERRIDGTPNPFFLRPYIGYDQPFTMWQPSRWDTTRAQLGYKLDLTRETNALRWLGTHQISGYNEYKYRVNRRYAYLDLVRSVATTGDSIRGYFRYYIGDNVGANVDHAPVEIANGFYPFHYGNPVTGFVSPETEIALAAAVSRTGGNSNIKTILKTNGGVMQSHFLGGRIVTTFGLREDEQYVKRGITPVRLAADGISHDFDYINGWAHGDYQKSVGKTKQQGVVVRPLKGWAPIVSWTESTGGTRILGHALNGLSLMYNKSDSFRPEVPRMDVYLRPLPNPFGVGKDYGFALNMFENRFVLRVNRYETQQVQSRSGDAGTIAQRVLRTDVASNGAFLLQTQALAWVTEMNPSWTEAQIQAEVGRQMGIPWERQVELEAAFDAGLVSSTNDVISKGTEIELNFNPTSYWTVAASATETQSMNANVSKDIAQWIDERMPVWTTIVDPRTNTLWWNTNYGGSATAAQNFAVFVGSPYAIIQQSEGTAKPQIRRYAARLSTNFRLNGVTDHRILSRFNIGGAVRWQDKAAIGYYGVQSLPDTITELDRSRPVYDKAQFYIDAFIGYRTRLWGDKVGANFQLNVRNLQEGGRLQPIGAYPDGTAHTYRIVDPRQFILQATFDL